MDLVQEQKKKALQVRKDTLTTLQDLREIRMSQIDAMKAGVGAEATGITPAVAEMQLKNIQTLEKEFKILFDEVEHLCNGGYVDDMEKVAVEPVVEEDHY